MNNRRAQKLPVEVRKESAVLGDRGSRAVLRSSASFRRIKTRQAQGRVNVGLRPLVTITKPIFSSGKGTIRAIYCSYRTVILTETPNSGRLFHLPAPSTVFPGAIFLLVLRSQPSLPASIRSDLKWYYGCSVSPDMTVDGSRSAHSAVYD